MVLWNPHKVKLNIETRKLRLAILRMGNNMCVY